MTLYNLARVLEAHSHSRKMENQMDMSAPSSSKTVLVHFQDQRRHVTFSSGNITTSSLICAFKETFADALGEEEYTT